MDLRRKVVVVTGANGALGRVVGATARACGASIAEFDIGFAEDAAGTHRWTVDLTDAAQTARCIDEVGDIDAVFNIAGGFAMGPAVHETKPEEWEHMFKMNVVTMRNTVSAVVPKMLARGGGKIVNVGAMSAREGQAAMGAYCAAKSVVMRLTESLSKEHRQQGININAVLPSIIDTPTNRQGMPDADFSKWVQPGDLANVICFLGSDRAAAVHGALVPVVGLS